jgi:hypothetical protein
VRSDVTPIAWPRAEVICRSRRPHRIRRSRLARLDEAVFG